MFLWLATEETMRAGLAIILASLVIGQTSSRARAAESSLAGTGDLSPPVGQRADIAPSAYFFRADGKPDDNPPETAFLFDEALKHARAGVICGLLWEEPRPVERIELTWPKDAQAVPPPADVMVRWLPHGNSSSWWSRRGGAAMISEKPEVSADGRTYIYMGRAATSCATIPTMPWPANRS
jgi:hypothetical protein